MRSGVTAKGAAAGLLLGAAASAGVLETQRHAQALVAASLEAHGGERAAKLHVVYRADLINEGQSLTALAPFEPYPFEMEVALDPETRLAYARTRSAIAGDFRFFDRTVLRDGKGFSLDPIRNVYQDASGELGLLDRFLPARMLLPALRNPASLRYLGTEATRERVSYATPNGQTITLVLDGRTRLLAGIEQVVGPGVYGDREIEILFGDYRNDAGIPLPGSITVRSVQAVHGPVENRYSLARASTTVSLAAADLELPPEAVRADYSWRPAVSVEALAPGVHLVRNVTSATGQWSYNVLAVEFGDHLLVVEAPLSARVSEQVLERLRQTAPGKPVRYLVQSHHHSDHIGGIRSYVADGVTLVLTPSTAALVERVAAAHSTLAPDRLARSPRAPVIERIPARGSRVFEDAQQQAVVFDVGPNPHANEMLVVWLPRHGVLYQSDLVNDGEYPSNATTRSFLEWLRAKRLEVRTLASLHGRTLSAEDVSRLLAAETR